MPSPWPVQSKLRGPAPVTYGATSFVGVIHVVHKSGAAAGRYATATFGSFKSGSAGIDLAVPAFGSWQTRLSVDGERQGYSDDRTSLARGHASYRGTTGKEGDRMWFMADLDVLRQDPASPRPRVGTALMTTVAPRHAVASARVSLISATTWRPLR